MKAKIGELFNIVYGEKQYHNKEWLEGEEGENILISSSGEDNGVYGFFPIENKFKAPFITVQGYGTIGQAFVQEYDCSVDDHLLILTPKISLTLEQLYQVAYQIRLLKWQYKYGRGITPSRLKDKEVEVIDTKDNLKILEQRITPRPKKRNFIKIPDKIVWKKVSDICSIDRKYYLYVNQLNLDFPRTPYITTTEKNNGVAIFCNEDPIASAKTLTVALDGKCGETFYQVFDYVSGEKTAIIDNENKYLLIYIGACIKSLSWKFHYGRKLSMSRLKDLEVPIPYSFDGDIDIDYIKNLVMNTYGFEIIEEDIV